MRRGAEASTRKFCPNRRRGAPKAPSASGEAALSRVLDCLRRMTDGPRGGTTMASPQIVHLTDDSFDETIKNAQGPVMVDFWAAWCGPCKMIAPYLDQLAGEVEGKATVAKVNVDENGDLSARFGIRSIPTLVLFKDGRVVDQVIGARTKDELRTLLQKHIS
jgi:thioredoxin 1